MNESAAKRGPGGPGSLFVFDSYNFIFRAYHALPMLNAPDGTPVNAVHGFARMVQAVRREFAPQYVLAVFDAGGDGNRRAVFSAYKANRPPAPDDLIPQFALVRQATDAMGIPRVEHPEFEADDLIASYTAAARARGLRVVIVSGDKDLMQLCSADADGNVQVALFDTMKNRILGPAEVEEKFGVTPARLGDLLALTGDSSDNVPGVPGIGPKTAASLLAEYGDLEGVLAAAPEIKQKKRRERLIEHADDARLSRRLVALHTDVALPRPLETLEDPGADPDRLREFFEPLGFKQVLREMGATEGPATSRVRNAARSAPAAAAAPEDPGAVELYAVAGFEPQPGRYRVLMADATDQLPEVARALERSERIGLHVVTATDDPLAPEILGIAVAGEGGEDPCNPVYLPVAHRQVDLVSGRQLEPKAVAAALRGVLEDPNRPKIAHAHKLSTHALSGLGIELAGVAFDPMLASYTLDPARTRHDLSGLAEDVLDHRLAEVESITGKGRKATPLSLVEPARVGPWACEQVEVVLALGAALRKQVDGAWPAVGKLLDEVEMPLATVLEKIERRGIQLDVLALQRQSAALTGVIREIMARVEEEAGHEVNLDSPIQLQKLLFDERGLPPTRKTKTGYSTDARALEDLALVDPIVPDILEYRRVVKLKNTYLDALPKLVRTDTGRLHTSFNQAVASTGRLSSSDPNLQNIPIRTPEGRRIREAFTAAEGRTLVALDYSQIELRVLAHLSGDPNLMSAFIEDVDVHRRTAAEVFGVEESDVDDEQRRIAKAVNFGVVYGQTAFGLAQQLGIPRGKAGSYIRAYFEKIPGVKRYMEELIEVATHRGYAETILGRRRRIPELRRKGAARGHGERIARNTPIQGSAADILKVAMIAVDRALDAEPWVQMLLTVHDELIFECDEARVDELIGICRPLMESAVRLSVPLKVDAGHGRRWADCKG